MKRMKLTLSDKLKNLAIFFFDSDEQLMALYLRQAKLDYALNNKKPKNEKLLGGNVALDMDIWDEDADNINFSHSHNGHKCSGHGHSH